MQQLEKMQNDMFERALKNKNDRTYTVTSLEEVEKIMNEKPGFVNAHWCGNEECENKIKEIEV